MSLFENTSHKVSGERPAIPSLSSQQAMLVGAVSPLWLMYMGASTLGIAYWSMTRWMTMAKPPRFSAQVVKLRLVPSVPPPQSVAAPEPVVEAEPVADVIAVQTSEPVLEAVAPAPLKKTVARKPAAKAASKKTSGESV